MSRAAPRPKRAGDDFARYGAPSDDPSEPSSKKPRFDARNPSTLAPDAPEEDAVLDLDEIGSRTQQAKRSAVNLDGYESDSSTEEAGAARGKRKKGGEEKSRDEEEGDMFADLEEDFKDGDEDEDTGGAGDKKKAVRFLDAEEIEGQVASSKSGGHVSADFSLNGSGNSKGKGKVRSQDGERESSSEDESGGEEERDRVGDDVDEELGAGAKKKHAPKLDAFNMKQEGEEGRFDESGNYVRKAVDPDAVHDSWLEGVSKKDVRRAAEAHEQREEERRRKDAERDAVQLADILSTLISKMEKGETVLEALQRLGKGSKKAKPKPKWQQQKARKHAKNGNGDAMDVDAATRKDQDDDPREAQRRREVEAITEAADTLLTRGETEIYDAERELLMRQYRNETGEDWREPDPVREEDNVEPAAGQKQWEYRWSDARDGGERHGPYDGATMQAWSDAGYFGDGVEFCRAGEEGGEWSRSVDFQ